MPENGPGTATSSLRRAAHWMLERRRRGGTADRRNSPAIRPPAIARSAMRSSTTSRHGLHVNAGRTRPSSRRPSRPAPSPSWMRAPSAPRASPSARPAVAMTDRGRRRRGADRGRGMRVIATHSGCVTGLAEQLTPTFRRTVNRLETNCHHVFDVPPVGGVLGCLTSGIALSVK